MPDAGAYDRIRAVVQGELRTLARQKTPFVLRTVYAALVAAGVVTAGVALMRLLSARGLSAGDMPFLGVRVFSYVVVIQATLAAVLGALLGVASIHGERQNKTLGLLVLSQLRAREIVQGKFLAILALVVNVLLAGLPVFAFLGWAGGVDYGWLRWLAFYTLALAALGTATGLHSALRLQGAAGAAALALTTLAVPTVSALPFWTDDPHRLGCLESLLWLLGNVALGVSGIASQGAEAAGLASVLLGLVVSAGCTWLLLRRSAKVLPAAASAAPGLGLRGLFEKLDGFFEKINVGGVRFELGASKTLRGHPVTWLTRTSSGLGLPHYGFRLMAFAVVLSLFGVGFAAEGGAFSRLLSGFWILAAVGVPIAAGANAFGDEKARQTLGVLLATPLTAWDLLRGKLFVFFRLLLLMIVPTLVTLKFLHEINPGAADAIRHALPFCLAEAMLAYLVALFLSLALSSPLRAGLAAVVLLAVVHLLYGAVWLSAADTSDAGAFLRLLPWILGTGFAGLWSSRRGHPAIGLAAFLAALAPLLALEVALPFELTFHLARAAEAAALAAFVLVYTVAFFDRAAGRSR